MSNNWFENYKRRMSAERQSRSPSPSTPEVSTPSAVNSYLNSTRKMNNIYGQKITKWKENVASGKINVSQASQPRPKFISEARRKFATELAKEPLREEPVYSNWKPSAVWNTNTRLNYEKEQKKKALANYFASMKPKTQGNIRHTVNRSKTRKARSTRKTRKTRQRKN